MVGAVLTQNTAWTNVERAIAQLRERVDLAADALLTLPESELASLIRPAGYFNVKARRLRAFCEAFLAAGGESSLSMLETGTLRDLLLGIHGVGRETADDMLLYAFERPVFVIDAYTRRLFGRLGLVDEGAPYDALRRIFEEALGPDVALFNEYHALIVHHAKHICRARAPRCPDCCLASCCARLGVPNDVSFAANRGVP
jgi:endonuclease-3 related protein